MTSFLQELSVQLLQKHREHFSRLCVVFPNRRAGLFFRQHIMQQIDWPVFAPQIFSIEDFVVHHTQLAVPDVLNLSIELYKAYKTLEKKETRPFIDFINWAPTLLSDFNEIDQYLVSGNEVFTYLDKVKAIQKWNLDGKPLTRFEENYLEFYNLLAPLYEQFTRQLLDKNQAYLGLAFRRFTENQNQLNFSAYTKIIFAGFNALSPAEEKLFQTFYKQGSAEFYWDADEYYVNDTSQEAGRFLRKYAASQCFGELNGIRKHFSESEKTISVVGVSGHVSQAKFAGEIIDQLANQPNTAIDFKNTALVLADEGLLLPVLNSLPQSVSELNITMGFPLKLTPVYSLLSALFQLIENANRFSNKYYHKDIVQFIQHPLIQALKNQESPVEVSQAFYSPYELKKLLEPIHSDLAACTDWETDGLDSCLKLIQLIQNHLLEQAGNTEQTLNAEYLYHFTLLIRRLKDLLADLNESSSLQTVKHLFRMLSATLRLPFYGEPVQGLQIMSLLETRTLDFENIILLSANDGLLPKGKQNKSFIPFDIRKEFRLPVYSDNNALFAYHFYRLLQRAKNVWLLYNTNNHSDGGGSKEPSRFITQLLHEMPQYSQKIRLQQQFLEIPLLPFSDNEIEVQKDESAQRQLMALAEKGFSPSSLGTYLNCKLQFYFRYILQIQEDKEVEETADAATIGTVIHEVLEQAYRPFAGNILPADAQKKLIQSARNEIKTVFAKHYQQNDLEHGKNRIVLNVIENLVERFLNTEQDFLQHLQSENRFLQIGELEKELTAIFPLANPQTGEIREVKIKGKVDRIDQIGSTHRIIDYKTGLLEPSELRCSNAGMLGEMKKPAKMLQLLIYAWLFAAENPNENLTSGIISLRQSSAYLQNIRIDGNELLSPTVISEFEAVLTALLDEILDPDIPFSQTSNADTCQYCDFKRICKK